MTNSSGGGLIVDPDILRNAGDAIVAAADELHRNVGMLIGEQQGAANANQGFASTSAIADCESGWEQALSVLGADLAVAGDTLALNAVNYARTEQRNYGRFGPK
jgi:hypothetical protein